MQSNYHPTGQDVENYRDWLRRHTDTQPLASLAEEELSAALVGAFKWINYRRWSVFIVATNYLKDGKYHA